MRIAFCLYKYFPFGGMQADCLRIVERAVARGHDVTLYVMRWCGERPKSLNIVVIAVNAWQNHRRYRQFNQRLQTILANESFDYVVGFNKIPGIDLYFAADPCYLKKVQLSRAWWYRLGGRYRFFRDIEASIFKPKQHSMIVTLTKQAEQDFKTYYQTETHRFCQVPPGIDECFQALRLSSDERMAVRRALSFTSHQISLLSVGSGFRIKGIARSLTAIAALPESVRQNIVFYIVGDDNPKPYLKQAAALGIKQQVQFVGGCRQVKEYMIAADLLLHPAHYEAGGKVLLEAALTGLPVVTTASCGYAHYITEWAAGVVLSEPFEPVLFQQTIMAQLQTLPVNRQERAERVRASADLFSLADKVVDIIEARPRPQDA